MTQTSDSQSTDSQAAQWPRLIGLSGKQFAGKDQVCQILLEKLVTGQLPVYRQLPLALAIKERYAAEHQLTLEALEANKAFHRPGLITLGDWGRAQDPDYWLKQVVNEQGHLIISDVRLVREFELLKSLGAHMIRVNADRAVRETRGTLVNETDPTECQLDDVTGWDAVLDNNETLLILREKVSHLLHQSPFMI
jgi:phosphomevalonate kinase